MNSANVFGVALEEARSTAYSKLMLLAALFSIVNNYFAFSQDHHGDKNSIEVYVSSQSGDRLTRKKDGQFTSESKSASAIITVDEKKSFQTIEGFGATFNEAGMICLNALSQNERNKVFESLFDQVKGAGFTLMKSPIAACDFASAGPWYSYDETPDDTLMDHFSIQRDLGPNGLITFIRKAAEFGKFRIESPMDFAPDWMYFSLNKGERHIKPQYYSALARYYSHYLESYLKNGVQIDCLNLFNEANNEWYSNVTYKEIAELIKNYVVPRFNGDGLTVKIQFGETANRPEAIEKFPVALDDVELRRHVNSLTVHGYDWNKFSTLADLHNRYPDLPIWQTEVCYAMPGNIPPNGPSKLPVYDFNDGEFWGNMIVNDMKNWVSAWIYWNMILDEQGGPWLVSVEHGDPDNNNQHPVVIINRTSKKVSYTGLYYYLSHFSRFVRPGASRIECSSGSPQLNFVGFKNADKTIVLNIINNGAETNCAINWNHKTAIQHLPAHSITTLKWNGSGSN
jgi:glucosylceramidase